MTEGMVPVVCVCEGRVVLETVEVVVTVEQVALQIEFAFVDVQPSLAVSLATLQVWPFPVEQSDWAGLTTRPPHVQLVTRAVPI